MLFCPLTETQEEERIGKYFQNQPSGWIRMFPPLAPGAELQGRCVPESPSLVTKPIEFWDPFHHHLPHVRLPQNRTKSRQRKRVVMERESSLF